MKIAQQEKTAADFTIKLHYIASLTDHFTSQYTTIMKKYELHTV